MSQESVRSQQDSQQTRYNCQDDSRTDLDDLVNPQHSKNGRLRLRKQIRLFNSRPSQIQKFHSLAIAEQFYRVMVQIDARDSITLSIGGSDQHDIHVPISSKNLLFTLKWSSLHNGRLGFDLTPKAAGLTHVDCFNNRTELTPNVVYFIEHNEQFELTTNRGNELFSIPDPLHVKDEMSIIDRAKDFFDVIDTDQELEAKSKYKRVIRQFHPDLHGDDATKNFVEAQQLWHKLKRFKNWK